MAEEAGVGVGEDVVEEEATGNLMHKNLLSFLGLVLFDRGC